MSESTFRPISNQTNLDNRVRVTLLTSVAKIQASLVSDLISAKLLDLQYNYVLKFC